MENKQKRPVALLTGASSGFGLLASVELAKAGFYVYATMRNPEQKGPLMDQAMEEKVIDQIKVLPLDVTQSSTIQLTVAKIKEESGRLDLLVNNAGYALAGCVEEISLKEWHAQFDTNFFGVVSVTREVIPIMREAGKGRIINMGSISGLMGFPALTPYSATKHAIEGFSESLRYELKPFGIEVFIIEPGSFRTNIWDKGKRIARGEENSEPSPYDSFLGKVEASLKESEKNHGDPLAVAKKIVQVACGRKPGFRHPIGKGIRWIPFLKIIVPFTLRESIVHHMIHKKSPL